MLSRRHFLELSVVAPAALLLPALPIKSEALPVQAKSLDVAIPEPPLLLPWTPPEEPTFTADDLSGFVIPRHTCRENYTDQIERILMVQDKCEQFCRWCWAQEVAQKLPWVRFTRRPRYDEKTMAFEKTDYINIGDVINRGTVDVDEIRTWWADFDLNVKAFLRGTVQSMVYFAEQEVIPELESHRRSRRLSGMLMVFTPPTWIGLREGHLVKTTMRMTYGTAHHDYSRTGEQAT